MAASASRADVGCGDSGLSYVTMAAVGYIDLNPNSLYGDISPPASNRWPDAYQRMMTCDCTAVG